MIKWLICFFWGHDIDIKNMRIQYITHDDYDEKEHYAKFWCRRCQKYKKR